MTTAIAPETSVALDLDREEQEWAQLAKERYNAPCFHGPKVSNKPHPDSYGADRPLWAHKDAGLTTLSAAERKELRARQIPLVLYPLPAVEELRASLPKKAPGFAEHHDTIARIANHPWNIKRQQKAQLLAPSVGFLLA